MDTVVVCIGLFVPSLFVPLLRVLFVHISVLRVYRFGFLLNICLSFFVSQLKPQPPSSNLAARQTCFEFCLFGDIYSCVCVSVCQNSENKSETPTNQCSLGVSQQLHGTHSSYAHLQNIV